MSLRAPFPWFGGKFRASKIVWPRFGDVPNYVEPFFGGGAVLLRRPADFPPRAETVNDKDAYLANFWRAVVADPDGVAQHADWPVNEADLHARHRWLVDTGLERVNRLKTDPHYFDAEVAGMWVWGQCLWIGSGWCARPEWTGRVNAGRAARGINTGGAARDALSNGVQSIGLYEYIRALQARMRRVRVCCGDWSRIVTPAVTTYVGLTGVFLDPPYSHAERAICYSNDEDISADVRAWAIEHGSNRRLRIALCGYEGEHDMPANWECVPWKAGGGYGRSARAKANRSRERIWFSPSCLRPSDGLPFNDIELDITEDDDTAEASSW